MAIRWFDPDSLYILTIYYLTIFFVEKNILLTILTFVCFKNILATYVKSCEAKIPEITFSFIYPFC